MKILKKVILVVLIAVISMIFSAIETSAATVKVTGDALNLRKNPSTSSDVLTVLSKGAECELIEKDEEWYKVKYKTYTGYLSGKYVKVNEDENTEEPLVDVTINNQENTSDEQEIENDVIRTGKLSKATQARLLPLINSSVLTTLKKNTEVDIITELNGWSYISTDEIAAWIRTDSVTGKKTTDNNTTTNTTPTDKVDDNQDTTNNNENETTTSETFKQKTMYTSETYVNVRKEPATDSDVLMVLSINTKLTVIGEEGDWYKVSTSEGDAYVSKKLLSDTKKTTSRGNIVRETQTTSETKTTTTESKETQTTTTKGDEIVNYAKQFLKVPYVYGGASSSGFDCSGFTMYVYKEFGISMRHGAQAQAKLGTAVSANKNSASSLKQNLKVGDLVFFLDYETMDEIGHCGIYIGDGNFIHASSGSGYCVKIDSLLPGEYYNTRYCAARRVI